MIIIKQLIINVLSSLLILVGYHYAVSKPELQTVKVIDIDYLLSYNEKKVRNKEISLDEYKNRIAKAEKYIADMKEPIVSKFIVIGNRKIPVIYGGTDLTPTVLNAMEGYNE